MGWQVIIAPSAQSDLADIVRYIARHNSDAAARLGFELITRAESLAEFPEIGRRAPKPTASKRSVRPASATQTSSLDVAQPPVLPGAPSPIRQPSRRLKRE
jgi:plasmid stabilization system protein ParE